MPKYRNTPEETADTIFITDGGLETVLIFEHGIRLPEFASYTIFDREDGGAIMRNYLTPYIELAKKHDLGFQLVDHGWRANTAWGEKLGFNNKQLEAIIRKSVTFLESLRSEFETARTPMPISGCIGPKGDGYVTGQMMSADEAANYHYTQLKILADTHADFATAMTISYSNEAVGIIRAAKANDMPITISFTVETDGRLPSTESLADAIEKCDAATGAYALGYMINCAHPHHFKEVLKSSGGWVNRIRGVRANASILSHAELDNATELDRGTPDTFGNDVAELRPLLPSLRILGGCCGTDLEHIANLAATL